MPEFRVHVLSRKYISVGVCNVSTSQRYNSTISFLHSRETLDNFKIKCIQIFAPSLLTPGLNEKNPYSIIITKFDLFREKIWHCIILYCTIIMGPRVSKVPKCNRTNSQFTNSKLRVLCRIINISAMWRPQVFQHLTYRCNDVEVSKIRRGFGWYSCTPHGDCVSVKVL